MIEITLCLSLSWPYAVLPVLLLAVFLVVAVRAPPEDLPGILATLSRWFQRRR